VNVPLARMLVLLSHCCKLTRCFQGTGAPNPTLYVGLSLPYAYVLACKGESEMKRSLCSQACCSLNDDVTDFFP
jgi:hypothetical protein